MIDSTTTLIVIRDPGQVMERDGAGSRVGRRIAFGDQFREAANQPVEADEGGAVWVLDPWRPGRGPIRTFPTPGRPQTPAAPLSERHSRWKP